MHADHGHAPEEYFRYLGWKTGIIGLILVGLALAMVLSLGLGSARVPVADVLGSFFGTAPSQRVDAIVRGIRLPPAVAAAVAVMLGSGLTTSGRTAVTIVNPYATTAAAFTASLAASAAIIAISRMRGARPETMILTGVALGALFTAATIFLQFFASDVQLAAMVFWTFGDTARASWSELAVMAAVTLLCFLYFWANSWCYNAIDAGDETARSLGVRVERVRMTGMFLSSLVTAVLIAFLGIIGFVGLIIPHMFRRLIGADHRFLLPASLCGGALLLLLSATAARLVLMPHLVPVSVLTAFLGAPTFLWLIIRRQQP
jgi:iron complex transport system permease protein